MAVDDVVEMIATYSAVITAAPDQRLALLEATRARIAARFPGAAEIDVPIRTWCFRADRLAR